MGQIPSSPKIRWRIADIPAQGDAALGIIMATNWHLGLDNPANKKFVASFRAKYKSRSRHLRGARLRRDQGDRRRGSRTVNGKIEDKDALRAAMRKAHFDSVRGKLQVQTTISSDPGPVMMEVAKRRQSGLTSKLKEVTIKRLAGSAASGMPDEVVIATREYRERA